MKLINFPLLCNFIIPPGNFYNQCCLSSSIVAASEYVYLFLTALLVTRYIVYYNNKYI